MSVCVSTKRDLLHLLNSLLTPLGYRRTKDNWYLGQSECISVIGISKSLYGGQFSLPLALFLPELEPDLLPFPAYHHCHFRGYPLEFLVPDGQALKAALNLETNLAAMPRISTITTAIIDFAIPFLSRLTSKHSIAQEIKTNDGFEAYCGLELKLALEQGGYLSKTELKLDL